MAVRLRLKALAGEKGYSLYRVSKLTGLPYTTIYRYANHRKQSVDFKHIALLCTVLDCDAGDLFEEYTDTPKAKRKAKK